MATSAHDVAYNVFGLAGRMAVAMGLHREVKAEKLHVHIRELRNRLWWNLYIYERQFTFQNGRPLMDEDDKIDTPFPVDIPDLCTLQYANAIPGQKALVELTQIMGRIVKILYSRPTKMKAGQVLDMNTFLALQTRWSNGSLSFQRVFTYHLPAQGEQSTSILPTNKLPCCSAELLSAKLQ